MINTEKIVQNLKTDGVSVIPALYSLDQIQQFTQFSEQTQYTADNLINNSRPTKYNYYTHFEKESCCKKNIYNFTRLNVLELEKGRYDISLNYPELPLHPEIEKIVNHFIKRQYSYKWGLLTSNVGSNNGPWHRDVVNIDGDSDDLGNYDDSNMVHHFSPFYYTILIPLVPLNNENGTTEFIKGSHRLTYKESLDKEHLRFNTKIGDAIIFDGRIFHRGCKNMSNKPRPVLYNMIHRNWYVETGI